MEEGAQEEGRLACKEWTLAGWVGKGAVVALGGIYIYLNLVAMTPCTQPLSCLPEWGRHPSVHVYEQLTSLLALLT